MTNRRELADRLDLIVAELKGLPHVVQSCREAARLLREPVAGEVEAEAVALLQRYSDMYPLDPGDFLDDEALLDEQCFAFLKRYAASSLRARLDDEGKGE